MGKKDFQTDQLILTKAGHLTPNKQFFKTRPNEKEFITVNFQNVALYVQLYLVYEKPS